MISFKAPLFLSALVCMSRAAPTEVVAGRLVSHTVPTLSHLSHSVPVVQVVQREIEPKITKIPAQYSFGYSVADTVTGDSKTRQETRNGDVTTGSYSVQDADGRIRTTTYIADANGYRADVTYDGEKGPVTIPIDSPTQTSFVSAVTDTENNDNDDQIITAARTESQPIRTVDQPATVIRTVAQPINAIRTFNQPITAVRTVDQPITTLSHIGHDISTVGQPITAIRTVEQPITTLNHIGHEVRTVVQPINAVRTIAQPINAVRTIAQPITTVQNAPLDLSQFRFIGPARII